MQLKVQIVSKSDQTEITMQETEENFIIFVEPPIKLKPAFLFTE